MEFSRQEYWSGLPFRQKDLPESAGLNWLQLEKNPQGEMAHSGVVVCVAPRSAATYLREIV